MEIFLQTLDFGVWDAVLNDPYFPMVMLVEGPAPKTFNQWTPNEFYRISRCKSANEMWDTFKVTHERTHSSKNMNYFK